MALIQCRDCQNEISKRAYFCPRCGGYTRFCFPLLITVGLVFGFTLLAAVKYLVFG